MAENTPKFLVRVCNTDLNGKAQLYRALTSIKGVGVMYANAVCSLAAIPATKPAGELSDAEVQKLQDIIRNPSKYSMPTWLFNRKHDYETGDDKHLITSDLDFQHANDLKRLQKLKSYRGIRLYHRLPVRGQRTKSNFRRNKRKASVNKKK